MKTRSDDNDDGNEDDDDVCSGSVRFEQFQVVAFRALAVHGGGLDGFGTLQCWRAPSYVGFRDSKS